MIERGREKDWFLFRNWLMQLWGLTHSKIYEAGQQPEDFGRSWCYSLESKGSLEAEFLPLQETSVFFFFFLRPLNDWMRPTHIMEGNLLYSEFILWNTHQSKKKMPSQEHLAWPNILAKLACRINHHSLYVKWDLRMKVGSYDNTE